MHTHLRGALVGAALHGLLPSGRAAGLVPLEAQLGRHVGRHQEHPSHAPAAGGRAHTGTRVQ